MPKDHYQILGVSRKATPEEIKKAYRKLTAEKHPDNQKNKDNPHAEAEFAEINQAYGVLSDAAKRAEYDAEFSGSPHPTTARPGARPGPPGTATRPQAGNPRTGNPGPMNDLLGGMFGGFAPGAAAKAAQASPASAPPAAETPITITLENAIQGGQTIYKFDARVTCPECRGSGRITKNTGPTACSTCSGKGQARRSEDVLVNIPAGIEEGGKLRVKGKGASDSRGQRGDLILTVRIKKDPRYELEGRDLLMESAIPYTVLVLGGEANVETPTGETKISVSPGTQHGARIKAPGMGLPALGASKPAGDLYVKVKVAIPQSVGAGERKLLIELAKMRNESVKV